MTNATATPNSVTVDQPEISAIEQRKKKEEELANDIKKIKADKKIMKLLLIGIYFAIAALHFARE